MQIVEKCHLSCIMFRVEGRRSSSWNRHLYLITVYMVCFFLDLHMIGSLFRYIPECGFVNSSKGKH